MLSPLRAFVRAIDAGSFSAAARQLGMAPSSVARQVDRLEAEVEARLLVRSSRSLGLTPAGERYLEHARRILHEAEAARLEARGHDAEPMGLLRVSSLSSFGQLRICPRLPEFFARYPRVRIDLRLSNRVVDLRRERFDVGVRIGPPVDSELLMRRLYDNDALLVCAPSLLDRLGPPSHPRELSDWPCLTLQPERDPVTWYFNRGEERQAIPVSGPLTSKGGLPLYQAALAGLGATVLMGRLLRDDLDHGRLVRLMPSWSAALREDGRTALHIVYPKERRAHPATRAFVDFVVAGCVAGTPGT